MFSLLYILFIVASPAEPRVPAPVETTESHELGIPTPIQHPPGQDALKRFHQALSQTALERDDPATPQREDQTRIVVYGASHVAGDTFTGTLRDELKARYGDGGIGFVVPAKPWQRYYNKDANISYSNSGWESTWFSSRNPAEDGHFGLAGVTFRSNDRKAWAQVTTSRGGPFSTSVDRLEVWYWKAPKAGDFIIEIDGKQATRIKTRTKKGERPGLAIWRHELKMGEHEIKLKPAGNGEITLFGVVMERSAPGIIMDSLGINGTRATAHLNWDAGLFTEQLQKRDPDLIILAYGTNEIGDTSPISEYARKLDIVINRVRSAAPRASCIFIGPSDRPVKFEVDEEAYREAYEAADYPADLYPEPDPKHPRLLFAARPRQQETIDIQREVAWRYGCGYWDWAHAMGGDLSMLTWAHAEPRQASRDYIHLNRQGYIKMARLFWDALMGHVSEKRPTLPPSHLPSIGPATP